MNVLWFVVDTLRSDHLSCYGYFRRTSPNIDRLAKEMVVESGGLQIWHKKGELELFNLTEDPLEL